MASPPYEQPQEERPASKRRHHAGRNLDLGEELEQCIAAPDNTESVVDDITLKASLDGGYSWNKGVLIDPGNCEYSDCAYMPDGRVAVVYEGEGERAIDFVAVPLEEVLSAK